MNFILFYHSLVSDWNHGNAHFLRGVAMELIARGHSVKIYEPENGWSYENLVKDCGEQAIHKFHKAYPNLKSIRYRLDHLDLDEALYGGDAVIVHEWNDHQLVREISRHRAKNDEYILLFHDTHHRSITDRQSMASYDLTFYDGVLAFGQVIRNIYLKEGWAKQAWVWHEAADTRVFQPRPNGKPKGDIVWVGNWGDEERTAELKEFLIQPVNELGLKCRIYGVRYPNQALDALADAGIEYGGWLPNYEVPAAFAQYKFTVHVFRRPYVAHLPGIPTIRPFEALACGMPLICTPWQDRERLFRTGDDYLIARDGGDMKKLMLEMLGNRHLAERIARNGRETVLARHTCMHRTEELLQILNSIKTGKKAETKQRSKAIIQM